MPVSVNAFHNRAKEFFELRSVGRDPFFTARSPSDGSMEPVAITGDPKAFSDRTSSFAFVTPATERARIV